jgi:hypothetical protein
MIHGYSLSGFQPADTALAQRFWYWRGASGRAYIHSIYSRQLCPRLAGAIYLIVDASGASRQVISVGRLSADGTLPEDRRPGHAIEEIHVHLLARDFTAAEQIASDLRAALHSEERPVSNMRAVTVAVQLELLAA